MKCFCFCTVCLWHWLLRVALWKALGLCISVETKDCLGESEYCHAREKGAWHMWWLKDRCLILHVVEFAWFSASGKKHRRYHKCVCSRRMTGASCLGFWACLGDPVVSMSATTAQAGSSFSMGPTNAKRVMATGNFSVECREDICASTDLISACVHYLVFTRDVMIPFDRLFGTRPLHAQILNPISVTCEGHWPQV